jgi:DNA (cytosine-5)-methyltransferase 1
VAGPVATIRPFLWGFRSAVHEETGEEIDPKEEAVPVRFSRTGSDGNPLRSFDQPFPAVDTATIWGWAQGHVRAARAVKDRTKEKFIRNPDATLTLWRISASRLRSFTHREYARLQTFPDDWEFIGSNKRTIHLQVGNAVPVRFAAALARNVHAVLDALRLGRPYATEGARGAGQLRLLA